MAQKGKWDMRKFLVLAIVAMAVFAFGASHADAKRPAPKETAGVPSCSVSPSPVSQWEPTTLTGSGFPASQGSGGYAIFNSNPAYGGIAVGFLATDAAGDFSTTLQGVWPGTNTIYTEITGAGGPVEAWCSFEVS